MDKQFRLKVDETAIDFFSLLPDEILLIILSFMTLQDAGRTRVLSHRWGRLWKSTMSSLPNLFLDAENLMGSDYLCRDLRHKYHLTTADNKSLEKERNKFVRRVNQFLQLYQCPLMKLFKIDFHLDIGYAFEIDRWIQTAICQKAIKLDIDLSKSGYRRFLSLSSDELYIFPEWMFSQETISFLKFLSLNSCVCTPAHDFSGFSSLVELHLETVYISDENIEHILANSSNLERLRLINCWNLDNLKIHGRNLVLKELIVAECFLWRIEVDAINLTYFEYFGTPVGLLFKNVPQLVNVVINTIRRDLMFGMSFALGTFSTVVPQIESLQLSTMTIEKSMIPGQLPTYANLKKLVLNVSSVKGNLFGFLALLRATPYLEILELHLPELRHTKIVRKVKNPAVCPLHHLKEVVISGAVWNQDEGDFFIHLIRNSEAINIFRIIPANKICHSISAVHQLLDGSAAAAVACQAVIMSNRIRSVLPAGAKLIIK